MKVCLIPPKSELQTSKIGDIHFILAHRALEDEEYAEFYADCEEYKIIDNGAYELGKPLDTSEIWEAAERVWANEIVLPDVLNSKNETYIAIKNFIQESPYDDYMNYMLVPHGETPSEWCEAYVTFLHDFPWVRSIGIPGCIEKRWGQRAQMIHYLLELGYFDNGYRHHLLGLDVLGELLLYPKGLIYSLDTSLPYSAAYEEKWLDVLNRPGHKRRVPYGAIIEDHGCMIHNIMMLKSTARKRL